MFQLKNFVSIAASMLNYVRSTTGKVTDLQPGSVTRTLLEAPAAEIEELYVQVFNGIREAIPVAVYNSIKFDKLPPQYASGRVTVIAGTAPTQAQIYPKGTRFLSRDGRIYESVGDVDWPAGAISMQFPVLSQAAGQGQNLAQGEINSAPAFDPDKYSFSNTDFTGGSDIESDSQRDIRFAEYISALSRGTEAALIYGAKTARILDGAGNIVEAVERVSLKVTSGSVQVNIWGTNGAPSLALLTRATEIEIGYQDPATNITTPGFAAAGIRCSVVPMAAKPIPDVTFTLQMLDGYVLDSTTKPVYTQQIRDILDSFLDTVQPKQVVYIDDIKNLALMLRGVKSASVNIASNITCGEAEVLVAGKVEVA
ncbi:baseplate J/gp47 family protein [Salmonella enterica]|nr:baseplate J/gp47 family protein [Salmonella enterica]EKK6596265.1 baseplate J/gp47 family protein [Salmonella enterica]